ncbi:MAG: Thioredoxin reductase, partial [Thermomicrobiales bacterium]|nr:Thioredoxin reductase [Thermomicrobiales bacterium]
MTYDVLIAGGGPAGLSAALLLGRSRRAVLVCDGGEPRNAASPAAHSFLTRDGTPPLELRRIGREQLAEYPSVELADAEILEVDSADGRFEA